MMVESGAGSRPEVGGFAVWEVKNRDLETGLGRGKQSFLCETNRSFFMKKQMVLASKKIFLKKFFLISLFSRCRYSVEKCNKKHTYLVKRVSV